jgi:UDP-GlcNAc:undecaprenyl-phosphate GlcNAc-1-phosphate transferase
LYSFDTLILILIGAFLLALILVPISTKIAWKIGAIDMPKSRGAHYKPIPRFGGFGIVLSLIITLVFFLPFDQHLIAFMGGLLVISSVGAMDDINPLAVKIKFIGQFIAALIFIFAGGGVISNVGDIFGMGRLELGWASLPFTILIIVGGINTINLSDGLDGLAGGFSVIAAFFLALFALQIGAQDVIIIAIALCGAVLGFLRFNTHPARLFMGDIGSLSLGYSLSALLVLLSNQSVKHLPLVSVVIALALPILDTLLVMSRRIYHGQHPFSPDKTHLHHRLLALNLPHSLVVSIMYILMATFGLAAVMLYEQPEWFQFIFLFVYGGALLGVVILAQHLGFNYKKNRAVSMPVWLVSHLLSRWLSRHGLLINRLLLVIVLLPAILFSTFSAASGWLPLILAGLLLLAIWSHRNEYERVLVGGVYVATVVLLFEFNLAAAHHPLYSNLLWITTGLMSIWVIQKLIFCQRLLILFTTGFELLLLILVWFIPFVMLPFSDKASDSVQQAMQYACLQSVPMFLLVKLHLSRDTGSHYVVLTGFIAVLTIVWTRGYFSF